MKIRRRTADGSKHTRFTFVYEAIDECGRVIEADGEPMKDYTKDGLKRKLRSHGFADVGEGSAPKAVSSARRACRRTGSCGK